MNVPVLWVSRDPTILHRGYADQSLLEAILARELWTPSNALDYEHYEVRGDFPDVDGAVVVIPFRHHIGHEPWLRDQLDGLAWSVVILTSEEEWTGDWRALQGDPETRRMWAMQALPEHGDLSWRLPCGWYPGIRGALWNLGPQPRDLDVFFAGQITHERREQMAHAMGTIPGRYPTLLIGTEGYFQGIPPDDYYAHLARTKIVPCPSGPVHACTARVEEALEAGCVPIVDALRPVDPQYDYWTLLFGDHPLRGIYDWETLPTVVAEEAAAWPANANRCWAWWQQWKRATAHRLDDDVRAVRSGADGQGQVRAGPGDERVPPPPSAPDDQITVIVTTSPVTMHPSTEHIEITINSIRAHLPLAEIIVVCDGVRPEQEHLRARYEEYQHRLFWLTNFHWSNVVPLRLEEWHHQAGAVREALELVTTPLVLMVEHDTPLKETPIEWSTICALVASGCMNVVRLHHEADILTDHTALMLDDARRIEPDAWPVPAVRTVAWWQRPHVASTRFYRDKVMPFFTPESRTMIEDPLYGHILSEYLEHGEAAWWDWRICIYAPEGSMQRSYHLDSRGDEPKYAMRFPGQ